MGGSDVPHESVGLSGLYNSPDPLLRRLRSEDPSGHAILDMDKYFRDKEISVSYAGSEQGSNNSKESHRSLTSLALKHLKTTAVVYVSTDTDPEAPKRVTKDVPWHRLTFNDNSDFAPLVSPRDEAKIVEIEDVERGEDFIQAGEIEVGAEKVEFEIEEYQHDYVRPLSRAALTSLMRAYSTPSLSVYHIPSHTFVGRNVKRDAFLPQNVDKHSTTWRNGTSQGIRIIDVLASMKWSLFALLLTSLYRLAVTYGGDQYNVVPKFISKLGWQG